MADTRIEWATKVWNPITGCSPISEGCAHCYAARMAKRLAGRFGYPKDRPFSVTYHKDRIDEPFKWNTPQRVFVCSMGDLFHEEVPFEYVRGVFSRMLPAVANKWAQHTFMVLTKRPEWMQLFVKWVSENNSMMIPMPHPGIWLGVTAESQERADERIPVLLETLASIRFASIEPMLGPVDLNKRECLIDKRRFKLTLGRYLDWVIVGCETGPGARTCKLEWIRDIRGQCEAAGVPLFVKKIRLEDGRISGDMAEWPEDLRIRQFPEVSNGREHRSSKELFPGVSGGTRIANMTTRKSRGFLRVDVPQVRYEDKISALGLRRKGSMKPLFIPLKREYFDAFERGEKTTEYRIYGPRWNEWVCVVGRPVVLSCGYGKQRRLEGVIRKFNKVTIGTSRVGEILRGLVNGMLEDSAAVAEIGIDIRRPDDARY